MVLYINGNFLNEPLTGVQLYAAAIIRQIDLLLGGPGFAGFHEVVLLMPKGTECPLLLQHIRIKAGGFGQGNLWEQTSLSLMSRGELLINLCNRAPLFKFRQLLVIHDASIIATPEGFSWRFRLFWGICYLIFGQTLPGFATVSAFSRQELQKYFKIPRAKINVIYPGVERLLGKEADNELLDKLAIGGRRYVLAVGGNKNKNLQIIISALSRLPSDLLLVIAGKYEKITPLALNPKVISAGRVTDEGLVALYKGATCLAFPSLYEGFGLPPIEAMSLGCPVVAAKRSSIPEVCGEAALYCDPENENDVVEKIELLLGDTTLVVSLVQRGRERAAFFSATRAVEGLGQAIEKIVVRDDKL